MTCSRIGRIKFFLFLSIHLLAHSAVCYGSHQENREPPESTSNHKSVAATHIPSVDQKNGQQNTVLSGGTTTIPDSNKTIVDVTSKSSGDANKTVHTVEVYKEPSGKGHTASLNPGALKRGFFVFVGLSVLVMAYIVFRSFRLSKTHAQMVRKYGVLAHRQDVEMRPLPLEEEDDEDTTVFDASNVLTNNIQHQNL